MFLGILTLITALSISAVAIYYSVAGLMTIFAAAAIPIMIMGGILEVSKLVTAVWLHRHWERATWWLKTYLSTAVIVLMFITSMGIFGYLSKAHIEQTASAQEGVAQITRIEAEIARNEEVIARAEAKIDELESSGTGASTQVQQQIDVEQARINSAYERIQPAIDEQNAIIAQQTTLFQSELDKIDADLAKLQGYIDTGEIAKAQGMVGSKADGAYGPKTAAAFTAYQERKAQERNTWLQRIQDAQQNEVVVTARNEIKRLRTSAEEQIAQSNALINNLREQLKVNETNNLQTIINEQNERVLSASKEIETLLDQKFELQAEYRKLEAEVGPVKYIAEFIYGEQADTNMLEEAVRWVILIIIFVFDPLAVLLLIAAQYTFEYSRKDKPKDDDGERLRLEREEYERARAQRIVDNPGYHIDTPAPPAEEKEQVNDDTASREVGAGHNGGDSSSGMAVAREGDIEDVATAYITADDDSRDLVPEADITVADAVDTELEQDEVPDDESPEEQERRRVYEELDSHESTKNLKQHWKAEHPNENLKLYKKLYIQGKIENLPWLVGYSQNSEQDENSLWNKIQQNR
jgi:hypothetical protein